MEEEDDGKGLWRRMMEDHLKHNESRLDTEMYQEGNFVEAPNQFPCYQPDE